ncbi:MAG: hypothetical protein R3E64_00015 [Halioglobus sp.]
MNWDAIGAIGEIIGAVAVLVTLIYLALQVRQTRKMLLAESIRATRAERREFFTAFRDSPFIHEILEKRANGEELSYTEISRLTAHHAVNWGQLYSAWLHDELDISGGYNTSLEANFRYAWSVPGSADWMENYGKRLFPKEFTKKAMQYSNVENIPVVGVNNA